MKTNQKESRCGKRSMKHLGCFTGTRPAPAGDDAFAAFGKGLFGAVEETVAKTLTVRK